MKNKLGRNLILCGALLMTLASCTKEIPFEALSPDAKEQSYQKSMIDTDGDYIYSSSQQNGSMSASDVLPYSSGENKRVKLEVGEKSIRVIEMERDQRYSSNTTNNKMVLEIPITHVQYQCAKDKFGECTNKEEDASDITWSAKNGIKVKFEDFKSSELELLPILDSRTFGDNCYEEKSSRLIDAKIESEAINFKVERTFVTRLDCANQINKLSDATITAIYQYSMVKTKAVLSPGYKTISYPVASRDENLFGFFATQNIVLDVDHNNTMKSAKQIMNRWNPERKELTYYLSDEFAKPENKLVNDLTVQTVNNVNDGLAKAGVNFRINLKQPAGKSPGDIRNSMIVLVEDPVASSVIGYGPQTEDPVTGEIFSARTIMFLGTIKKFVQYTYNDIVAEKNRIKFAAAAAKKSGVTLSKQVAPATSAPAQALGEKSLSAARKNSMAKLVDFNKSQFAKKLNNTSFNPATMTGANASKVAAFEKSLSKKVSDKYSGTDLKSKLRYLNEVKNCAFNHADGSLSGISDRLMAKFEGDLAPWSELSDSEKQAVVDKILPDVWVNTLIHELGHNLGLRHNFEASTDLENFYSTSELQALNVDHESPFSSVMDYGDDLKTLPVFGKYDIAALRFGYNRELEVVDTVNKSSRLVKLESTIDAVPLVKGEQIKNYKYCTDQNAGGSITCNRFDLGTDVVTIVKNHIAEYEKNYNQRNFKNNRADFSLGMPDLRYANRIRGTFIDLRLVTEIKELFRNKFGIPEGHPLWTSHDVLKPYQEASALVAQFLSNVVAMPTVQCALADKNTGKFVGIVPLDRLDSYAINCSEVDAETLAELAKNAQLPAGTVLESIGQAGKHLNSKKASDNPSTSLLDIDVRGIWMDKAIALDMLLNRKLGQFDLDRYSDNYLNQADASPVLLKQFNDIMAGELESSVEFTFNDGSKTTIKRAFDATDSQMIEVPMHPIIGRIIGVNESVPTTLQELVAKRVAVNAIDTNLTSNNAQDINISNAFTVVTKYATGENKPWASDVLKLDILGTTYIASPSNVIAYDNMLNYMAVSNMELLTEETLAALLAEKKDPTKPFTIPAGADKATLAAIEAVIDLPAEMVEAYLKGGFMSSDFYAKIVKSLPTSSEAMAEAKKSILDQ